MLLLLPLGSGLCGFGTGPSLPHSLHFSLGSGSFISGWHASSPMSTHSIVFVSCIHDNVYSVVVLFQRKVSSTFSRQCVFQANNSDKHSNCFFFWTGAETLVWLVLDG